jgi:hypothetical protein
MRESFEHALGDDFTRFVERVAAARANAAPEQRREASKRALENFAIDLRLTLPRA